VVYSVLDDKYAPIVKSYAIPSRPPTPSPEPPFGSPEYWRTKFTMPRLPPRFQARFPFNVIVILLLPLLIPLGISAALIRVSRDSKSSRKRIRQLETDESFQHRLVNVLKRLDKGMENTIADLIEDGGEQTGDGNDVPVVLPSQQATGNVNLVSISPPSSPTSPSLSHNGERKKEKKSSEKRKGTKQQNEPALSDIQLKLIDQLNALPFNKYIGYFPGVFSSHAVIVSRDIKQYKLHAQGRGVLRHWADHFIL
jgi:hypothetical protein